jgi:hypothetical protein
VLSFEFRPSTLLDVIELLREGEFDRSYSCAMAVGDLQLVVQAGDAVALSTGTALDLCKALSAVAEPGEVVIHDALASQYPDDITTRGKRTAAFGNEEVTFAVLAAPAVTEIPPQLPRHTLAETEWFGPPVMLATQLGHVSLLRAGPGSGGTRFLRELAALQAEGQVLSLSPARSGEPLGALRGAFQRVTNLTASVGERTRDLLAPLMTGEGLDVESAGALIGSYVEDLGHATRLVMVDEVEEVDADTLDALALAAAQQHVALVLRLYSEAPIPEPVDALPRCVEHVLTPLDEEPAIDLVGAWLNCSVEPELARRLAWRANFIPGATRHAICEALATGELTREGGQLRVHASDEPEERPRSAAEWIRKRLSLLTRIQRLTLEVLASTGGLATRAVLAAAFERAGEPSAQLGATLDVLAHAQLIEVGDPCIDLGSATLRRALLASMSERRRRYLWALRSTVLAESQEPLANVPACLMAWYADSVERCDTLAPKAVAASSAAGLDATSDMLAAFAQAKDEMLLATRGLRALFAVSSDSEGTVRVSNNPVAPPHTFRSPTRAVPPSSPRQSANSEPRTGPAFSTATADASVLPMEEVHPEAEDAPVVSRRLNAPVSEAQASSFRFDGESLVPAEPSAFSELAPSQVESMPPLQAGSLADALEPESSPHNSLPGDARGRSRARTAG